MPEGHVLICATVALPAVPSVAGAPLIISFAAILFIATPPVAGAVPFSPTALANATTFIVTN